MIYFIRHGESEANVRNVFAGQKDNSFITQKGKDQAIKTGEILKSEGLTFERVISSSLNRTRQTAEIVTGAIGFDSKNIEIDERIMEYDMGTLTGTPLTSVTSLELIAGEGAEDVEAFKDRIYSALKEFSQSEKDILVVSHGGVARMIEIMKENGDPRFFYDVPLMANASVMKIDWIK